MNNTFKIVASPETTTIFDGQMDAWIDRDGIFYVVGTWGHGTWVHNHIEGGSYGDLEATGWVHLTEGMCMYEPHNCRMKITPSQRDTLNKWNEAQTERFEIEESHINSLLDCGTLEGIFA